MSSNWSARRNAGKPFFVCFIEISLILIILFIYIFLYWINWLFFNSRTAYSSLPNHQRFANPSLGNLDLKNNIFCFHNILLNKFTFSASATAFCLADVSKAVWAGQWHHFLLLLPLDKINCRLFFFAIFN